MLLKLAAIRQLSLSHPHQSLMDIEMRSIFKPCYGPNHLFTECLKSFGKGKMWVGKIIFSKPKSVKRWLYHAVQCGKKALLPYANSKGPVQSDLEILCSSTYITVSIVSVSGQQRPSQSA